MKSWPFAFALAGWFGRVNKSQWKMTPSSSLLIETVCNCDTMMCSLVGTDQINTVASKTKPQGPVVLLSMVTHVEIRLVAIILVDPMKHLAVDLICNGQGTAVNSFS